MPRGIDHIVHVVRDLDAAGDAYRRLGFTVGARNRHPWGTHNRIVQFPGCFIELLEVAEPEKIPPDRQGHFSFGAFNRDFLAEAGEGLSMLVLESADADSDAAAFDAAGIGGFAPFRFERKASRPDGTGATVAFSLAFATPPDPRRAGFFVCQQHFPENFWNPAFQRHPNGARGIAGIHLTAADPARYGAFLAAFAGVAPAAAAAEGIAATTPRGIIRIRPGEGALRLTALWIAAPERAGTVAELHGAKLMFQKLQEAAGG